MSDGIIGTGNLIRSGQDCGNTFACATTNIANFGQKYFYGFIDNLSFFTYSKAINYQVVSWFVIVVFLMLFLSFIVGFIFFNRK